MAHALRFVLGDEPVEGGLGVGLRVPLLEAVRLGLGLHRDRQGLYFVCRRDKIRSLLQGFGTGGSVGLRKLPRPYSGVNYNFRCGGPVVSGGLRFGELLFSLGLRGFRGFGVSRPVENGFYLGLDFVFGRRALRFVQILLGLLFGIPQKR